MESTRDSSIVKHRTRAKHVAWCGWVRNRRFVVRGVHVHSWKHTTCVGCLRAGGFVIDT